MMVSWIVGHFIKGPNMDTGFLTSNILLETEVAGSAFGPLKGGHNRGGLRETMPTSPANFRGDRMEVMNTSRKNCSGVLKDFQRIPPLTWIEGLINSVEQSATRRPL